MRDGGFLSIVLHARRHTWRGSRRTVETMNTSSSPFEHTPAPRAYECHSPQQPSHVDVCTLISSFSFLILHYTVCSPPHSPFTASSSHVPKCLSLLVAHSPVVRHLTLSSLRLAFHSTPFLTPQQHPTAPRWLLAILAPSAFFLLCSCLAFISLMDARAVSHHMKQEGEKATLQCEKAALQWMAEHFTERAMQRRFQQLQQPTRVKSR